MSARLAILGAMAAAGCGLALDFDPPDPEPDATKVDGGSPGADTGPITTDAGPPPMECGGLSGLVDSFETNEPVPHWAVTSPLFPDPSAFAHDPSGALRIRAVPGVENAVISRFAYRLVRDEVAIHVTETPAAEGMDVALFGVARDETRVLGIACDGEVLAAFDGTTPIATIPYRPDGHRWWRIRSDGETLHFEARGDGDTIWEPIASMPEPSWTANAFVVIGVRGSSAPTTVEGDFVVDAINTHEENDPEALCPIESFVDPYGEGPISDDWLGVQVLPECLFVQEAGRLVLGVGASDGFASICAMRTVRAYELTETGVFVELDPDWFPDTSDFQAVLALQDIRGRASYVTCQDSQLQYFPPEATAPTVVVGTCPSSGTIWSFHHIGEQLVFTARDPASGATLVNFGVPPDLDLGAVGAAFGVYSAPRTAPYRVHVRGYNVADP